MTRRLFVLPKQTTVTLNNYTNYKIHSGLCLHGGQQPCLLLLSACDSKNKWSTLIQDLFEHK